jgi:hypothetical protein
MALHLIVAGDTASIIESQLDGVETLAGCTVRLHMALLDGSTVYDLPGDLVSATDRVVRCVLSDPTIPAPGVYAAEWRVTFPDAVSALTWPTEGTDYVRCRGAVA